MGWPITRSTIAFHCSGGLPSPDEGLSDEELAQKIQVTGCEWRERRELNSRKFGRWSHSSHILNSLNGHGLYTLQESGIYTNKNIDVSWLFTLCFGMSNHRHIQYAPAKGSWKLWLEAQEREDAALGHLYYLYTLKCGFDSFEVFPLFFSGKFSPNSDFEDLRNKDI